MKVYGIKNCDTVRKALKFFKEHEIEYEFIDLKQTQPTMEQISQWSKKVDINKLFNNRGKTYRTLKLKELNLDDEGKKEWLGRNSMLFKRPIIQIDDMVLVGFDEEQYREIFI